MSEPGPIHGNQGSTLVTGSDASINLSDSPAEASNPQRLNRSSIRAHKSTRSQISSSAPSDQKAKPLSARKVNVLPDSQVKSELRNHALSQELKGTQQLLKGLHQFYQKEGHKEVARGQKLDKQVHDWEVGFKNARQVHKQAVKQAKSGTFKLALEKTTHQPAALTPAEKQAQKQLEEATELLTAFKGKHHQVRQAKKDLDSAHKKARTFDQKLSRLEQQLQEAAGVLNSRGVPASLKARKHQVEVLESKLTVVKKIQKKITGLEKEMAAEAAKHPEAAPSDFSSKVTRMKDLATGARAQGKENLAGAKMSRDQAARAQKKARKDEQELAKSSKQALRSDKKQDRQIQQRHEQAGNRTRRNQVHPESSRTSKIRQEPSTRKASASKKQLTAETRARQPTAPTQKAPRTSAISSTSRWTAEDQALLERFETHKSSHQLKAIKPKSGKSFEQLEKQLWKAKSVDDIRQVVVDRRATKIPVNKQQAYLGLLNSAVQGLARNPVEVEKMTPGLIKDLLKEQPEEARAAIKLMQKTQTENLEKRLRNLRRG